MLLIPTSLLTGIPFFPNKSLSIYFCTLLLNYLLYAFLKEFSFPEEYFKIIRNLFSSIIFILTILYLNIIKIDFYSINTKLILIYGLIAILFIFSSTSKDHTIYPLHTIVSSIFLAPFIEEIICREISYNSDHLLFSFCISSFIFIVLHFSFDLKSILYFMIISLFLFLLRTQTNSVLNSILLHSIINSTIIIRSFL